MNAFEKLKSLVLSAEADAIKFYTKGNRAAGTRLRKAYQQMKTLAHQGRLDVSSNKKQKLN